MSTNNRRTLTDEEKDEFAHELALGYFDDEGLCMRFELTPGALEVYKMSPQIQRLVLIKQREIDESDAAIRIHARRAARVAIQDLVMLVRDEDAPAKTRMQAGRELREYATVVDKQALEQPGGDGPLVIKTNLSIDKADGVYALTARDVDEQMSKPQPDTEDTENFEDLLYG